MNYEPIIKQANRRLDQADWLIAIAVIGALIAFTPLYASASIVKAHTHVVRVPMLTRINAKLLSDTLMPVRGVVLREMTMRLPPVLPRRAR